MATVHQFLAFRPTSTTINTTTSAPLGLLTTVADLPLSYKIRYITPESPLDLSVRPSTIITTTTTTTTESTTTVDSPITPPSTPSPIKKRYREDVHTIESIELHPTKIPKNTDEVITIQTPPNECTPKKPIPKTASPPKTSKSHPPQKERKAKVSRKLKFDETTSSPVSGTVIRPLEEIDENLQESGDIDPQYNIVEITDEAKAELAMIPNVIGAYNCKLCRSEFDDAFGLAQHRCSCIVLLDYLCPECGKRFNCPANLASHRRWHKPKGEVLKKQESSETDQQFACDECGKYFKRQAYLRKHMATHKSAKPKSLAKQRTNSLGSSVRSDESNSSDDGPDAVTTTSSTGFGGGGGGSVGADSDTSSSFSFSTQRVYKSDFTDDENLAIAALAHLRNGPSVIKHTTALVA